MKRTILACSLVLGLVLPACSDDSSKHDAATEVDLSANADLTLGDASSARDAGICTRAPRADGPRFVAVSHPFGDNSGAASNDYELLALATDGALTRPNTHFQMGVGTEGSIVFTPDGEVGYSTQDDGTIGIFAVSASGVPTVLEAGFAPGPYASGIVMGPMGDRLYVVDADTTANGGGIYEASIACDGRLGMAKLVTGADIPSGLVQLATGDYAFYARTLSGAAAGQNIHRATLDPYVRSASATASFALAAPMVGSSVATSDGKYALFGDTNGLSAPDSISIVATSSGLAPVSMPTGDMGSTAIQVNRPYALIASPYDNAILVVSDYDNAFYKLTYAPTNATTPFTYAGAITYKTGSMSPQLPGTAQLIDHGALKDHVFVAELSGVRQVQFQPDGTITDLGLFDLGADIASSLGILGIQP
jgi:hypothetical protein